MKTLTTLAFAAALALPSAAFAIDSEVGEELDITAGAVTGLSCALEARETGDLRLLATCPLREALKGIVVYDVTEGIIVKLSPGKVAQYKLESAYGGGSIDVTGTIEKIDKKTEIVELAVEDYSVTEKPKAGGFKGCL